MGEVDNIFVSLFRTAKGFFLLIYTGIGPEFKMEIMPWNGSNMVVERHHTRGVKPVCVLLLSRPLRVLVVYYVVVQSEEGAREYTQERT